MSRDVGQRLGAVILGTRAPLHNPIVPRLFLLKFVSQHDLPTRRLSSRLPALRRWITNTLDVGNEPIKDVSKPSGYSSPRISPRLSRLPASSTPLALSLNNRPHRDSYKHSRCSVATTFSTIPLTNIVRSYSNKPSANDTQDICSKTPSKGKEPTESHKLRTPGSNNLPTSGFFSGISRDNTHVHLRDRIPHIPQIQRPTRDELLAAATGFWSRLKVRFKWFSIRSVRPFNADEIGAFFSWFLLGHVLWIILGTTTFFSLAILAANTVLAQETLARWVGNYLTKSSGVKVVFESAIVPRWRDGVITFKNVFVSRRPGQGSGRVSKGSPSTEAAAAAVVARADRDRKVEGIKPPYHDSSSPPSGEEEEDTNYTQFDLSLDTINVTLSFTKWFNSKGLLQDVEIKGVRGVIDRTFVHYSEHPVDPKVYRHEHSPGDFEINSFKLEDLLVTVHQPDKFRPFSISIYSCDLPQLRRQWLFYDFLSANTMSGSVDESLFTIHPRQMHGHFGNHLNGGLGGDDNASAWKKQSRLRIDGLNVDHLNRGVEGPFSWIREGNVDIVADIKFPADTDEGIVKIMSDFYERMEATVTSSGHLQKEYGSSMSYDTNTQNDSRTIIPGQSNTDDDNNRLLVLDLKVHLNDIRAVVPIFTKDLSYVNNALIRPIVAYMNSRKTFIPINCRVTKRASEFDGSWTIFDSGLLDDLSAEVRS